MDATLMFKYDCQGDILHIDKCQPYAEQESQELGDDVVARLNPPTFEIESLEVMSLSTRRARRGRRRRGVVRWFLGCLKRGQPCTLDCIESTC